MRTRLHALAALLLGGALLGAPAQAAADTNNEKLLKTDLLVVTAHPDDEGMMGATMARYADRGKVVALVSCTHGEGGGNGTGKESGAALGVVREAELRGCLADLGVRHLYFLNQPDWAYTESVRATLARWGHKKSLRRLVRLVRLLRPEVVCTMDPAPVGGQHGHHQAAGRLATEAFEAAADPAAFPELEGEGLAPWRVRKLYWSSWGGAATVSIPSGGKARGALAVANPDKRYADIALKAASHHKSQGFDKFLAGLARMGRALPARPNGFLLVKSRVPTDLRAEKDLFDAIAEAERQGRVARHDLLASRLPPPAAAGPVSAGVRPRDNVLNYRRWLKANGLSRLMTRLPAHVTVVRGRSDNRIEVEVKNHSRRERSGTVSLQVPSDWALDRQERSYTVAPGGEGVVIFRCTAPAGAALGSHDATVRCGTAGETAKLDVVPELAVRRLRAALPVDGAAAKWERAGVAAVPIPPTSAFQGRVRVPKECSGRFFAGYDSEGIQVLVDVSDDTIARNIAPDDIKAHWRSTSVEICLDPAPWSESTFTTLKLGIFPGDTAGNVRAARDADARPGELGQIGSKIRLAAQRTPAGYVVEARIPWSEVGLPRGGVVRPGQALGFNVILYHAGQKAARIGEDVGKARLAWSPGPGVPGRPEVWGRAVLE
jgi:LmbE family N-acetylglucosaminyl deacetylase